MGYQDALNKGWSQLSAFKKQDSYSVRLMSDEYSVDINKRSVLSSSCNVPAHDYIIILVLHYLIKRLEGLPELTQSWISFQELDGGKGYYPTFKKRVIEPIVRKYAKSPEALLSLVERFSAKRVQIGDFAVVLEAFQGIPMLVTFWKADEEFSAEANVLFDTSIKDIFSTEDIVVLAEFVARNI